jgi:hypothetical protein
MEWNVVRNTGDRAFLERGDERKEVDRPKPMSQDEFRELIAADSSFEDSTVGTLMYGLR